MTLQVWYLDRAYDWHFLAPNFTTYFRMMLVHLGLPQWQALFTPFGPTPWAKVSKSTEFPIPSFIEIFWLSFREFPRLMGHYCS